MESALEGEITDHLGYDKHGPAGKNGGNSRNGTRAKTVLTDVGPVEMTVPRDLLRNSFRYAARQDWDKIAKLLKRVYTAATEEAALERFAEFADTWG